MKSLKKLTLDIMVAIAAGTALSVQAALAPVVGPRAFASDDAFLDYVQQQTFHFFWDEANPGNGLIRDRSSGSVCSIASVGFGLSAINVAIDRGWIDRPSGTARVSKTLHTLWSLPQGDTRVGFAGNHGWFYHFLDLDTGLRAGRSEVSSIDTALLMMGVIDARQFFTSPTNPVECQIRTDCDALLSRMDWSFMLQTNEHIVRMEWNPETGFGPARWVGYNEASCLYLLGLGMPKVSLPTSLWDNWTAGYQWSTRGGQSFVAEPSLFTHQYSQVWFDFRGIADAYMRTKQSDYFENSRRATLAQLQYSIENPFKYPNYGPQEWGFTACDGPGITIDGIHYAGYKARGAPAGYEDGTVAPTAACSSLPFAPQACLGVMRHLYDAYTTNLWTTQGFRDAYNRRAGWWDSDVVGIDEGPIVLMLENHRTGSVWTRMLNSPIIQRGLQRAGFTAPPPDHLHARMIEQNQIELTWRDNSAYETGFEVEGSTDNVVFSEASEVGPNVTKAMVSMTPAENWFFRVRTKSAAGISGYRETIRVQPTATLASRAEVPNAQRNN